MKNDSRRDRRIGQQSEEKKETRSSRFITHIKEWYMYWFVEPHIHVHIQQNRHKCRPFFICLCCTSINTRRVVKLGGRVRHNAHGNTKNKCFSLSKLRARLLLGFCAFCESLAKLGGNLEFWFQILVRH